MEPQLVSPSAPLPRLELDLIGDLVCPWTFIAKRSLDRALGSLYGSPDRLLRWHGLPLRRDHAAQMAWREHFASRLPEGTSIAAAERELRETGGDLGIEFVFERLERLPDTREAHRLVLLAARDGRQGDVIDAVMRAFFERGCDVSDRGVLGEVAQECSLSENTFTAFGDPHEARDDVDADEHRLRGLGVAVVPNLLINGRVLVPGPADVDTYVQALDQALFPGLSAPRDRRLLH